MYWLSDPLTAPPRVGYSIGRSVGPAVTRNRVRRRLRALLADRARAGQIVGGWYVVGCRADAASAAFGELGEQIDRLLVLVGRSAAASRTTGPTSTALGGPR